MGERKYILVVDGRVAGRFPDAEQAEGELDRLDWLAFKRGCARGDLARTACIYTPTGFCGLGAGR